MGGSANIAPPEGPGDARAGGVPRAVKVLGGVSFFNDVASEMVYPLLPALVTRLGGGAIALGALDGAAELVSAALKWVSGTLADRPGWRRPLILVGYLVAVLVRPLVSVTSAAWQVIGLRVIDRVGKGLRTPPRDALIAELTLPEHRGRAFGFHRAADHLGAMMGAVAAWALLAGGTSVRDVIGWSIVPGIVAFLLLAVLLRSRKGTAAAIVPPTSSRTDATGRVFWVPVAALVALTLARLPETLMLLRLQDLGVRVPLIPLVWGGLHVVRSVGSYPGGRLVDRAGPRITVAAGGLLTAAVLGALALPLGPFAAILVFLAFGLAAGLTESAERVLVARLAPVRAGRGFGAYHALTGVAALPAALGFGVVYQSVGGSAAFTASAGTLVAAVVLWGIVAPRGT
jgi:MFS family permease